MSYDPSKYLYYIDYGERRDAALLAEHLEFVENSRARGKAVSRMRFPERDENGPSPEEVMRD